MSRRHVFTVNLRDDAAAIDAYIRHHRAVWPEVQASLLNVGVERMDIYLLGRRLVMIVDMHGELDYRSAFESHTASSPRVAEWERLMKSLQEPAAGARPNEWWAVMEPVFHLDNGTVAPQEPAIAHVADRSRTS